ncbi:MAG TPA: TonB-dependent receptor [Ohtaekwangia sp.]|nr:TonB-dependent receptor [Ohtaekwangia sp.]
MKDAFYYLRNGSKRFWLMSLKKILFIGMCLNLPMTVTAHDNSNSVTLSLQEIVVNGKVTDEKNSPLPGVNVVIEGSTIGTVTDMNGEYALTVSDGNAVLLFSFIGYVTKEISVGGQTRIDVQLKADTQTLSEVVVVGYGTQRKSDLTGSVGQVSAEDILERPITNALQGLQGRVPGVNISLNSGSPTASPRVTIRGLGTINASSTPLYVVDGVAMEDIAFLNPYDIESIEVLKDASSTAIYGSRGANGVILVTTKRGAKTEGVTVGYDAFVSIGTLRKKMDIMNSREWLSVVETGFANSPKYNPNENPVFTTSDPNLFDADGNPLYDTDWQEEATRTAVSHNHQISIQTKSEKSSLGAFVNYARIEGIMLNSWLERMNGKIAYDVKPKKWLSAGMNLLVNVTKENGVEERGGSQVPRRTMIEMPPIFPVKFPDGTWSNSQMISDDYRLEAMANPVHVLETEDRLWDRTQIFGNVYLTFHLTEGLDLKTQFGFDRNDRLFRRYAPDDLINIASNQGGVAEIDNERENYWQQETFLSYNRQTGDHRINAVLGLSWQERNFDKNDQYAEGFTDNFFKFNNIDAAARPNPPESEHDRWALASYFLRSGYTFKDRYILTLTGRVDGSSRFGDNNKYGFFPSAGIGWLISNESFMDDIRAIDALKFRASYGVTGNTEIGSYESLATISSGTTLLNNIRSPFSNVTRLPNPDLSWEKTQQFDIGFELDLFNSRVSLEFDYYDKLTTDLLLDRPVPNSTGFSGVYDNIGKVSNRGVEFLLNTVNIDRTNFSWETTLNFNYNRNRIEKLGENDEDIFNGPFWVTGSQTIFRVGEPIMSFWGYERLGTWGTDENPEGALPGQAKRSDEPTIIGKGIPSWTGSFINSLRYNNFDLTLDLQFVYDVDIMQQFYHSTEDRSGIANGLRTILDGWTPENQNTMIQEIRHQGYGGQDSQVDSRWIADGSYLRVNLISLGYNFSGDVLERTGLSNFRVYASVQNAFVFHSDEFQGFDPESTSWDEQWTQNIFFFQYPRPRTFTLGINLKF